MHKDGGLYKQISVIWIVLTISSWSKSKDKPQVE